jgi:chromosome segregation ATPase
MTKRQEYLELEKGSAARAAQVEELRATVAHAEEVRAKLESDALTAEVLGEPGWKKKREDADHNRDLVTAARTELAKAEGAVKVLNEEMDRVRPLARAEILADHRPEYAQLLQALYDSLKVAADAESELLKLEAKAQAEGIRFGVYDAGAHLMPAGKPNLTLASPRGEAALAEFKHRVELNDYALKG